VGNIHDSYQLASADEALAMLDAFVAGERQVLLLQEDIERAGGEAMAWDRRRLRSLIAEQQRRYEALEAWWTIGATVERQSIHERERRPAAASGEPAMTRFARWLQHLVLSRRRPCTE
jgi:hypothetical protein